MKYKVDSEESTFRRHGFEKEAAVKESQVEDLSKLFTMKK